MNTIALLKKNKSFNWIRRVCHIARKTSCEVETCFVQTLSLFGPWKNQFRFIHLYYFYKT